MISDGMPKRSASQKRAPRARNDRAMPTQFNAAPKLASGNSAMVGLALRVNYFLFNRAG
ncbi:hypothetical protein [Mesorhizobium sp. B2-4-17]|uniref:hypothetical protein n=1 Tax=Mesorhizobium sp. B2-4-17 TaxID=2589932 RepID=UPI0015E313D9|nr:hypothetical protein [Mesorhizobium sp. B2-4-17]